MMTQVVLEDGRVIQEDLPEVTVDTTEDRQSHVESDVEDRDIADNDWDEETASAAANIAFSFKPIGILFSSNWRKNCPERTKR